MYFLGVLEEIWHFLRGKETLHCLLGGYHASTLIITYSWGVHSDSHANKGGCGVDIKRDGSAHTSSGHDHLGEWSKAKLCIDYCSFRARDL